MNLNPSQEAIVRDTAPFIQVVAGAGAGKTSTMVAILNRWIQEDPNRQSKILVLTFSRKATHEFQERLTRIHPHHQVRIQTFHAYCFSALSRFSPEWKESPPTLLTEEEKYRFFKNFFQTHKFRVGGIPYKYLIQEENPFLLELDPELWNLANQELQLYKKQKSKLEFHDLVTNLLEALRRKENWTFQIQDESRIIIVDEFQDTDFEQLEFLQKMAPERLIVVGDDWQAIYGFRGATPEPFLNLENYFKPLKKHFLTTNYRSLPEIVQTSEIPIYKNTRFIPKNMKSAREGKANLECIALPEGKKGLEQASQRILASLQQEKDTMLLCRTNFRIVEFQMAGIPPSQIMTIHASKGLEFNNVFLDLLDGWNHGKGCITQEQLEEERRILYVGLSRAKNSLFILGKKNLQPEKKLEDEFFSYFHKKKIFRWIF